MKKLLFLLLLPLWMSAQVSTGQEQDFDYGIKNNAAQTVTVPLSLVTQGAGGTYGKSTAILADIKNRAYLSTGLIKNGLITINDDPTKYNISAGIGIISNFDDPENPTSTLVNFSAITGHTPAYLNTGNITYVAINSSGIIVESASQFTTTQRRDLIILGAVIHSNLTSINVVNNIAAPSNAVGNQLHDFMEAIGALNLTGNKYTAAGANLQLNKSAGTIFKFGVNFATDWKNPHQLSQASGTSLTFRYRTQNGTEGSDRINLDPSLYDVSNTLTAVPNNKFTIQTVTVFQTGLTRIQYGQNVYDDLASAQAAVFTRDFVVENNILMNGITRAYIIVKNNATSLQSVTDAKIIEAQKFGGVASGGVALTFANIVTALGYTPENVANKVTTMTGNEASDIKYLSAKAIHNTKTNFNITVASQNVNAGIDNYRLEFGQEYLAYFQNLVLAKSAVKIIWSGDSTTDNAGGYASTDFMLNTLYDQAAKVKGVSNLTNVNNGHTGETTTDWKNTRLATDLAANPDLYIWRWGINDPYYGISLATFESNLRTGLATIRASKTQSQLSILLMTPNTTSDEQNGRDERWHEQINHIIRKAARDYQCGFIDTFSSWVDSRNGAANLYMDLVATTPASSVHPKNVFNTWIVSKVFNFTLPDVIINKIAVYPHYETGVILDKNLVLGGTNIDTYSIGTDHRILTVESAGSGTSRIDLVSPTSNAVTLGTQTKRQVGFNNQESDLVFYTNLTNSGTTLTDAGRFTQMGNFGIGTATPGVTPNNKTLGFLNGSNIQGRTAAAQLAMSSNIDGDYYAPTYKANGYAAQITIDPANMGGGSNGINFSVAASGTTGNPITWTRALTILETKASVFEGVIRLKNYTVSTLPTGTQGDTAYVTDAIAPTYLGTLTGGGSVKCPVFYNGTAWVSH